MSTVVHHGLSFHLESQMMEYKTLKLKLSSPKLSFSQSLEMALQLQSCVMDCEAKLLDNPVSLCSEKVSSKTKLIGPYVHSSVKRTSAWLSEKSLNLCTENLGSETGSELIENSIFSSQACSNTEIKNKVEPQPQRRTMRNRQVQFPPPLTTLHGADSIHVKSHREDGKLILKVTRSNPSAKSCFLVDRSNGRLRLSLTM